MTQKTKQHPDIKLHPVESSQIHAIGHDPISNTLSVQFKSKNGPGSVYHYANFDAKAFDELKKSKSIGSHFGSHIKPHVKKHPFSKVS